MGKTTLKPIHIKPRPGDIIHSYGDIAEAKKKKLGNQTENLV